ncbi:MAG: hypothetical protein WC370_08310 [Dehalococcoidales bacterium]|jgi:hypothetical protein
MPFSCKIGDSFYLPDIGGRHRYVILTNPNSDGKVVLVNFTDSSNVDSPVIFGPRDDKLLFSKRTGIYYAYAQLVPANKLKISKIEGWEFCQLNNVKRIIIGAFKSQHTPIFILKELSTQYPEEHKRHCTWDFLL